MIKFIRNLLFEDAMLKIFSLTLAVLIWVTINFAIQRQLSPVQSLAMPAAERTFYGLPVLVMSSAEDVKPFRVSPKEVNVTVQGEGRLLQSLQARDIRVIVDLTGIETARFLQKRIEISTPPGVTYSRIEPSEVQVVSPAR
jgi:YbbR domain-containing protein